MTETEATTEATAEEIAYQHYRAVVGYAAGDHAPSMERLEKACETFCQEVERTYRGLEQLRRSLVPSPDMHQAMMGTAFVERALGQIVKVLPGCGITAHSLEAAFHRAIHQPPKSFADTEIRNLSAVIRSSPLFRDHWEEFDRRMEAESNAVHKEADPDAA